MSQETSTGSLMSRLLGQQQQPNADDDSYFGQTEATLGSMPTHPEPDSDRRQSVYMFEKNEEM